MSSTPHYNRAAARTWRELCAAKQQEYRDYLEAFPSPPNIDGWQIPSGDPPDFGIWRELYFGQCDALQDIFRARCVRDVRAMLERHVFERCRSNPGSSFPADRGLARCIAVWLAMFAGEAVDTDELRLAADDCFEWVANETFAGYDEIDEFSILRCALLYYLVGDEVRAEMMVAKLPGRKAFHLKLASFVRGVLGQAQHEEQLEQSLREMLAADYYMDPKRKSFVDLDVNLLLIAAWACFKERTTVDKAARTAIELSRSLVR